MDGKISWTIKGHELLKARSCKVGDEMHGPYIILGNGAFMFYLRMHPFGRTSECQNNVSIYLQLIILGNISQYIGQLKVKSACYCGNKVIWNQINTYSGETGWGRDKFKPSSILNNESIDITVTLQILDVQDKNGKYLNIQCQNNVLRTFTELEWVLSGTQLKKLKRLPFEKHLISNTHYISSSRIPYIIQLWPQGRVSNGQFEVYMYIPTILINISKIKVVYAVRMNEIGFNHIGVSKISTLPTLISKVITSNTISNTKSLTFNISFIVCDIIENNGKSVMTSSWHKRLNHPNIQKEINTLSKHSFFNFCDIKLLKDAQKSMVNDTKNISSKILALEQKLNDDSNNNNDTYIEINDSINKLKQDTKIEIETMNDIKNTVSNVAKKIENQKQYFDSKILILRQKSIANQFAKESIKNTKMDVESIKGTQRTMVNDMGNMSTKILILEQKLNENNNDNNERNKHLTVIQNEYTKANEAINQLKQDFKNQNNKMTLLEQQLNDKNNEIKNLKNELLQIKQENNEVSQILKYADIDEPYFDTYYKELINQGFKSIKKMKYMDNETLKELGIKQLQHRMAILDGIEHFSVDRGRSRHRNTNINNDDNIKREHDDYRSRSRSRNQRNHHSRSNSNPKVIKIE